MEQKVVKVEVGKVLVIVIAIVLIALIANSFLQSNYFKGSVFEHGKVELNLEDGFDSKVETWDEEVETALDGNEGTTKKDYSFSLIDRKTDGPSFQRK